MKCELQNTSCPFMTVKGCYYILNDKICAIQSGIDLHLFQEQVKVMTTLELSDVRDWCCDIRDLIISHHICPITMTEVNEIDSIIIERMKTGYYIRQHGQSVKRTHIPSLVLLNSEIENSDGRALGIHS